MPDDLALTTPTSARGPSVPRRRRANRDQATPVPLHLDDVVPEDALCRILWDATADLEWTAWEAAYTVEEGGPGRAPAEARIVLVLWLYAYSQGVTSARQLAHLTTRHLDYIWICGKVSLNYHRLSDFRSQHEDALDDLFVQLIGCLAHAGIVEFAEGAQDGVRVRASAGSSSFHRRGTLEAHLTQAEAHLAALRDGSAAAAAAVPPTKRQQAARARGARERVARIKAALAELPAVEASRAKKATPKRKPNGQVSTPLEARASETDREARVMKMGDGGFRPGYNVQFFTDTKSKIIIGVRVSNSGSDMRQAIPMLDQVQAAHGAQPLVWLGDGGYPSTGMIEELTKRGITVLAPAPTRTKHPEQPRSSDTAAVQAWRARMATAEAKSAYKRRAETAEWVHALGRVRYGLTQFRVRGQAKVRCVALWMAVTHAFARGLALGGRDVFAASAQVGA